jgi:hypothetical protein
MMNNICHPQFNNQPEQQRKVYKSSLWREMILQKGSERKSSERKSRRGVVSMRLI